MVAYGVKVETLARQSHGLRNALGAIATAAEVLNAGAGGPATAQKAIDIIARQSQQAARLRDRLSGIKRDD